VVLTVKLNGVPTVAVAVAPLVIAGACTTVREKLWVAVPTLFVAEMVRGNSPPAVGAPEMVAVPLLLLVNATPPGRVPVSVSEGTGVPDVVTVKLNATPTVADALDALVITGPGAGDTVTVRV
jgi:hypothetical protein